MHKKERYQSEVSKGAYWFFLGRHLHPYLSWNPESIFI